MSLHFILDGYNISGRLLSSGRGDLAGIREGLIHFVEHQKPQGNNSATIVFDGQAGIAQQHYTHTVKVIFSQGESADDKICRLIEAQDNKKRVVLVTDDRQLQFSARALGAKIVSVEDFLVKTNARGSGVKNSKMAAKAKNGEKNISHVLADKINSEFSKIWLKRNEQR